MKVEVVSADHQNKPRYRRHAVAGQWFDRDGVDIIVEVAQLGRRPGGCNGVMRKAKNKVYINSHRRRPRT